MRLFWVVMAVLLLAGATYWVMQRQDGTPPAPVENPKAAVPVTPRVETPPPVKATDKPAPSSATQTAVATKPELSAGAPHQPDSVKPGAPSGATQSNGSAPSRPPAVEAPKATTGATTKPEPNTATTPRPTETPKSAPTGSSPATAPMATGPAADEPDPLTAKIETKDDGSLLIDGKYAVTGKGTAADPYKVTWDQLLSVQDVYAPKQGKKKLPGRITMLDGKWVEITGYIAFPIMAETQDEALSMMNQWDGCCIGVPPTPYDAIEVRLKTAATGNARLTTYGKMTGKFKVDPHLVGGWLVGLYVMDDAELSAQSYGGFAP